MFTNNATIKISLCFDGLFDWDVVVSIISLFSNIVNIIMSQPLRTIDSSSLLKWLSSLIFEGRPNYYDRGEYWTFLSTSILIWTYLKTPFNMTNLWLWHWLNNYILLFVLDVIIHSCPNFLNGLVKSQLKLEHTLVLVTFLMCVWICYCKLIPI